MGGTAYSGGVITRYYDSLLVKFAAKRNARSRRSPAWTGGPARIPALGAFPTNIRQSICREIQKQPDFPQ